MRDVIRITHKNERTSNDMVTEHLPEIFSSCFDVENDNLLNPKPGLDEIVRLEESIGFNLRVSGP